MPPKRPDVGTTTSIGGLPFERVLVGEPVVGPGDADRRSRRRRRSPCLPMTGTKLPASLSCLKKSRPGLDVVERCRRWRMPAAQTPEWPGSTRSGHRASATWPLVLGLEQVGPVLRDVRDDLGVDLERQHAVVVAVPHPVGILGRVRDRVPGRDLVRLEQALRDGLRAEGQTDVDDVRRRPGPCCPCSP